MSNQADDIEYCSDCKHAVDEHDMRALDGCDGCTDCIQIAAAINRSKIEIRRDIATGLVPGSVRDFATLHDFVDANCYGGLCDDDHVYWGYRHIDPDESRSEAVMDAAAKVQEAVHQWLQKGMPR